ncbi:GTPase-activating protein [Podila humilis]|nr:GTPase-activating protein [Podila humilis]
MPHSHNSLPEDSVDVNIDTDNINCRPFEQATPPAATQRSAQANAHISGTNIRQSTRATTSETCHSSHRSDHPSVEPTHSLAGEEMVPAQTEVLVDNEDADRDCKQFTEPSLDSKQAQEQARKADVSGCSNNTTSHALATDVHSVPCNGFLDNDERGQSNSNRFLAGEKDVRTSISSSRSFSSHTNHHSFGYKNHPEQEPSESESESESDQDVLLAGSPPDIAAATAPSRAPSAPAVLAQCHHDQSESTDCVNGRDPLVERPQRSASQAYDSDGVPCLSKETSASESMSHPSLSPAYSDYLQRRMSNSGSETSVEFGSPALYAHQAMSNSSGAVRRTFSRSSSRGFGAKQDTLVVDKSRVSDTRVNADDLNEISLADASPRSSKRASIVTAPRPNPAAGAGFPSSFFGARPHPMAQLHHHGHPSANGIAQTNGTTGQPATLIQPVGLKSGASSISSIASSISGAFRGLSGSQGQPTVPRTPSRNSDRGLQTGMAATAGIDLRPTTNMNAERASIYSTMTIDSNMELLLARLDAQNTLLDQGPAAMRRPILDSDMDRVIDHAKESTAGQDVDWDYWGALMHDYNAVVKKNPKQLTHMIQRGVPPALRGLIWQILSKSKDAPLEASYGELLKTSSLHEKQILRDMSRTFPNHDYFQDDSPGQGHLFNVVKAYSLHDHEVGYCQGLSFVVGPLLLNMPDEEAFCVLVRMMNSYEMRGHYTPDMHMLQLRLYQYEQLMEEHVPIVCRHFQNQGIRSTMYASQWFMTLFAYKFPLELVFRVYDILFVEGIDSILRFAIALLKANHNMILEHDFETLIEYLKNGLFDYYIDDPSMFIRDAYDVKITPKKLSQYTQKYNALVQKQQAEVAAEESLRESNRQLSGHVRRLEGALHTLNKEHVDLAKELISRKMEMALLQDKNDVLSQKVLDLTKIVDAQAKEVEARYENDMKTIRDELETTHKKNKHLEEQMAYLESMVIESKMQYAESENEKDALAQKLHDLKRALGGPV